MKTYIKPRIKEKNVELQSHMMSGSKVYGTYGNDDSEQYSNSRRGSWGDLWNNDDEE